MEKTLGKNIKRIRLDRTLSATNHLRRHVQNYKAVKINATLNIYLNILNSLCLDPVYDTKKNEFQCKINENLAKNNHYRSTWPFCPSLVLLGETSSKSKDVGLWGTNFKVLKLSKLPLVCFSFIFYYLKNKFW